MFQAYARKRGLSLLAMLLASAAPCAVLANPQGGAVTAGSATISGVGSTYVTITQSSDKAVIDWRGFDIANGETTSFVQPNSGSITLNRVNSASASFIDGTLNANGNVVIVNSNGVLFGKNAQVNVNGLIATTADIDNDKFMAGSLNFNKAGNPNATIENRGTITAKDAGLVGLVAPNVLNSGTINAKLGRVQLASGDTVTVDLYGDGLMEVKASSALTSQLVQNTGTINAEGGTIALTAAAAAETVNSLISVGGTLNATNVGTKNGNIYIYAEGSNAVADNVAANKGIKSGSSTVKVTGTLNASNSSGTGGKVTIAADKITIGSSALIKANGSTGGGTIKIGGNAAGIGTTPAALMVLLEKGASLQADATDNGKGGSIVLWSDIATYAYGSLSAKGGVNGGDGGTVETSGKTVDFTGLTVDTSAAKGSFGTWLIDPEDLTVDATAAATISTNLGSTNVTLQTTATTASGTGTVTTGGSGDITINGVITATGGGSLTLSAYRHIVINSAITLSGGSLLLQSNNADVGAGAVYIAGAIATNGGNITIGGGSGTITAGSGYAIGDATYVSGVNVNSALSASGGNIVINGKGYSSTTVNYAYGVSILSPVTTTGTGTITVYGTGGSGSTSAFRSVGVRVGYVTGNVPTLSTVDGAITIYGTGDLVGGSGSQNFGYLGEGKLLTSGNGSIVITGVGGDGTGGSNHGVNVYDSNGVVTTGAGSIVVTAVAGLYANTIFTSAANAFTTLGSGNITFYANGGIYLVSGAVVSAAKLTMASYTNIGISVGSSVASTANFSDATLASTSAASYVFGALTTGNGTTATGLVTVNTTHDFGTSNVTFISGGDINLAGALTKATGAGTANYWFAAKGDIYSSAAITATTGAINLTLQSDYDGSGAGAISIGGAITTNGGNITIGGGSGTITAGSGYAVGDAAYVNGVTVNSALSAAGGNIVINGRGYAAASNSNAGITTNAAIATTGTGAISLYGIGGGTGYYNYGLYQAAGAITAVNGNITIDGTGGGSSSGNTNYGVYLVHTVSTSGSGSIFVTGRAEFAGSPIVISSASTAKIKTTGTGNITLTSAKVGSEQAALNIGASKISTTGTSGNITLYSDVVSMTGASAVSSVGTLTIASYTNIGMSIGSSVASTLNISDTSLGYTSAASYVFGALTTGSGTTSTGLVTVNTTHDFGTANVTFISGGRINLAGTLTKATGTGSANYIFQAVSDIYNSSSASITATTGLINLTLQSNYTNSGAGAVYWSGGAITTNGGNITIGGGSGTITAGSGYAVGDSAYDNGVYLSSVAINTGSGNIIINGSGYASSVTSGNGVFLSAVTLNSTGNLTINGTGAGTTGSSDSGVVVSASTIALTGAASQLALIGTGGGGSAGNNYGVSISSSSVSTTGASSLITLTGTGGTSYNINYGVVISSSTINAASTGAIALSGTGGSGGNSNSGIILKNTATVSVVNGALTVIGTGGASNTSYGVATSSTGTNSFKSTGTGNISITGYGGTGSNAGVIFNSAQSALTTVSGNITIRAIGGTTCTGTCNAFTAAQNNAAITSANGLTIYADTMDMGTSTTFTVAGTATIAPYTNIGLSIGSSVTSTLNVSDAQLSYITASSYVFGALTTGNGTTSTGLVTVNTTHNFGTANVTFLSGGDINLAGTLTKATGTGTANYWFAAAGSIYTVAAITASTGAINLILQSDYDGSGAGTVNVGGVITSNGGNITIGGGTGTITAGSGYAVGDATYKTGVTISSALIAGGGNIIINGQGYVSASAYAPGIVDSGSLSTIGTGAIALHGIGGGSSGTDSGSNYGLDIYNATLSTVNGALSITGIGGGSGAGTYNLGINVRGTSLISVTGNGALTLTGTGANANGTGSGNFGIYVWNNAVISGTDGSVTLSGTGGGGSTSGNNMGVYIYASAIVRTTGNGNIFVTGIAGAASNGIQVNSTAGGFLTTGGGSITVKGVGASGVYGFRSYVANAIVTNGTGNITLYTDTIQLVTAGSIVSANTLTIAPYTNIGLSVGSSVISTLNISNTTLGYLSAASYVFGALTTGNGATATGLMTVSTTNDFGASNVTFLSGGDINLAGTLTKATGTGTANYWFAAAGSIYNSNSAGITASTGAVNLTLQSDYDASESGRVSLNGGTISTNGGNVTIGGGSGAITAGSGYAFGDATSGFGVRLNAAIVTSGGNVIINGKGYAGNTTTSGGHGIYLSGSISTGAGSIYLSGVAQGSGSQSVGVVIGGLGAATPVLQTTSGNITIVGTNIVAGTGTYGLILDGSTSQVKIVTDSGSISLNGTGSTQATSGGTGIRLKTNVDISSTSGTISVTAAAPATGDAIVADGTINVNAGSGAINVNVDTWSSTMNYVNFTTTGTITVAPITAGVTVSIGSGAGTLKIDAYLAYLSASSYVFGSLSSGLVTVNTTHDFGTSNVTFISGGDINLAGTLTKATGAAAANYIFQAKGSIYNSNSAGIAATTDAINLTLDSNTDNSGGEIISLGTASLTTGGGTLTISDNLAITGVVTINDGGGSNTVSTTVSGTGSLVKTGSGTLTLSGANTYTGATTVSAGTATISGSWNVGSGTATTSVASGATLDGSGVVTASTLSISGVGTINLTGNNMIGALSSSGTVGSLTLNNVLSLAVGAVTTNNAPITLTVTGAGNSITTTGVISVGTGNLTLTADDLVIGAALTGSGTLGLQQTTSARKIYINYGTANGTNLNLNSTEVGYISSSWGQINLGRSGTGGFIYVGTSTWSNPVRFITADSTVGSYITGAVVETGSGNLNFGTLRLLTDGNITTNGGSVIVGGNFYIYAASNSITTNGGAFSVTYATLPTTTSDLTVSTSGGAITLSSILSSSTGSITLNAGSGTVTFNNTVNTPASISVTAGTINLNGYAWGTTTALGAVTLTATNSLTLSAITTNNASVSATVTGAGNSITTTGVISVGTGNLTLTADDMTIGAALTGTGILTISPTTASRPVFVNYGTADGTNLNINSTEQAYLLGGWNSIYLGHGNNTAGGTVHLGTSSWNSALYLMSGHKFLYGNITMTGGASLTGVQNYFFTNGYTITTDGGAVSASVFVGGTVITNGGAFSGSLLSSNNGAATSTSITTSGGTITISNISPQNAANTGTVISLNAGSGVVTFNGTVNSAGSVSVTGGAINLNGYAWGGTTALGAVTLTSTNALTLPSITASTITALTTGIEADLTLASGTVLTASGAGNAVVLSAMGALKNNAGSGAISLTGGGRWLVYSATVEGDTFGSLNSGNTAIWGATYNTLAPGSVSATGNRYIFAEQPTLTVTSTSDSKTYGNTATLSGYTITGYSTGVTNAFLADSFATTLTGVASLSSTGAAATANVGTYTITVDTGSLATTSGYALDYVSDGVLTVTARAITVTADAQTRYYGDANGTLTYTVGGGGLVNGDTLTGGLTTTAATTSNVGAYGITQGTLAASSNYSVTYISGNITITARPITVTADNLSRYYGSANGMLTYVVGGSGLVNGDTLTGGLTTTATTTSNVGTYGITQGTLTASSNYAVTYVGGNVTVTARPITVAADAASRYYGDANGTLTYTVSGNGLVNGDTLSGALATTATTTSNVGTYGITQGTVAASSNYAVTFTSGNLTVVARPIIVTANSTSHYYGDANGTLTYTVGGNGLVNGDTLSGSLATTATTTSTVGTYAITQGTVAASSNYSVTFVSGNLTVQARQLTVTANSTSRYYGDANGTLTYTLSGGALVNGDTLSGTVTTTASTTSNVGTYAITQGTVTANSNYTISFVNGTVTVVARPIIVTANSISRYYGDANGTLTYVVGGNGLVNGDTTSGSLAATATTTSNVGTYAINQGSVTAGSNYSISFVSGNVTVIARPIIVTANNISRYYGDANGSLTYTVGGNGLANGDTLSGALTSTATTASTIGAYGITQGTLAASSNYTVSFVNGNLTVVARPIIVTANSLYKIYGDANPALTYTVGGNGLANGDTLSGALTTAATTTSDLGSYAITQGTIAASPNYTMTFVNGVLTIGASPIVVTPTVTQLPSSVIVTSQIPDIAVKTSAQSSTLSSLTSSNLGDGGTSTALSGSTLTTATSTTNGGTAKTASVVGSIGGGGYILEISPALVYQPFITDGAQTVH